MENFKIDVDADGVALITFDVPGRSMNTLTSSVMAEIPQLVERIKTDDAIKGAVLTSGKTSGFCAGADLGDIAGGMIGGASLQDAYDAGWKMNGALRALETCGKPVAAAINGLALGGGLELTLACHYRVVENDNKIQLGLPEIKVGLFPGGGGTQRLTRLIGVQPAMMAMTEGKSFRPNDAKGAGIVHEIAEKGQSVEAAKTWIKNGGKAVQPWDDKSFKLPGGGPYHPAGIQNFLVGNAMIRKQTYGNYPAATNLMKAVYEGVQVPMDAALRIETRYFIKTLMTPQAQAMIRSLFLSKQELDKGAVRPAGVPKSDAKKVTVLGAGMMGAGVAYVQVMAGIETVLIDQTQEAADKGKAHVEELLKKRLSRGQMTQEKFDSTLALVTATTDYDHIKGSDLVIEAVFENREIKADVTKRAEAQLAEGAVFGSNTSTLPITGLAEASVRPEDFIGIHFFSPVDKMMLVEIILGEKTGPAAIAKAIDYVLKIKKTPIVVNDSRGFYTSRCFSTFLMEGMAMLEEGYAPALIDNVGRMTGMPRGPLEMHDDVALDLSYKIAKQTAIDLGDAYVPAEGADIVAKMVEGGRYGRKNGKGFYDYDSKPKTLWAGLSELAPVKFDDSTPELVDELKTRLLYRQAVEVARCWAEGVIDDPREADLGAILGWGFAPWSGGPITLIDQTGLKAFVETADRLTATYGDRFKVPELLREMAAKGETFYGRFAPEKKAA
ncbi:MULTISPECIES: 3-hydroxyacyl-CoA dehydrogenase NAD-binding domain-containing protein [unclassified Brevundimonas]|uniref:3-hydroxyacyl-CoA dehydrogenase NAD-binding domain-containing protein n=1 Tax=unclassified Brevundimonas TaxID=2622653 RepID=UPI000CFDBDB9|nr:MULTISPECIES: 3-hydroxyacyl-CoA dehydrogenase NAD-binding domain-containing protein [unclassified Brevundimonas]PRA35286.1 3-hydroxyacyl-CoA dehydrogenase [Brevundimonas sp. MYb27]PQZ82965.1 3-hydroxyacyl-CoA dehydrogenase [Brevundimonas sp. MYb31]PRB15011.1 3-hydroxyacyl-CoA dehydrogenase [Brevundimonas sp. MYb52]PRB36887.1 3-hydroxyacyl-CoA dehydrogenase [Brevundimonas sp. MYb46]PRB52193.1 3-hydroxyacyl-CoA dehydrogenase [Brevundimonas sp. MYb33]